MASRLIHYLIGTRIMEIIPIDNRNRFLLGSLLPDVSSHEDGSYFTTHFFESILEKQQKGINWRNFEKIYSTEMRNDSLYLGYYCHLIMDCLWFQMLADKYTRKGSKVERQEKYKKGYRDYWRLNYLLKREYDLEFHIDMEDDIPIHEIDASQLSDMLTDMKKDFECIDIAKKDELEIYPYEDIINYINVATNTCVSELQALAGQGQHLRPQNFYVAIL